LKDTLAAHTVPVPIRVSPMPLWMLILFAVCSLTGAVFFGSPAAESFALPAFIGSLLAFLGGLGITGLRRPVV
jgi:hypothetical protein